MHKLEHAEEAHGQIITLTSRGVEMSCFSLLCGSYTRSETLYTNTAVYSKVLASQWKNTRKSVWT